MCVEQTGKPVSIADLPSIYAVTMVHASVVPDEDEDRDLVRVEVGPHQFLLEPASAADLIRQLKAAVRKAL